MAILRSKDIAKMTEKEMTEKVNDLKIELIKVDAGNKKGGKHTHKEIKRTIAKLLTFIKINKDKQKSKGENKK